MHSILSPSGSVMANLPRPSHPRAIPLFSSSLDTIEIEPTQVSYPRLRHANPLTADRKREETLADILKIVRQSPQSPICTGSPDLCHSSHSSRSYYFTEPTDDTDEVVSPRQPPASQLRPSDHSRRHHTHHRSLIQISPFAYTPQTRSRHVSFDSSFLHLESRLTGHRNTVSSVLFEWGMLVSGSSDYDIKVWRVEETRMQMKAKCVFSVLAHKSRIRAMTERMPGVICSVSSEPLCYLWSLKPEKVKKVGKMTLLSPALALLCPSPLTLLTGAPSGEIHVNSFDSDCAASLYSGHTAPVTDLTSISSHTFLSASVDTSIRLWDFRTRASVTTLREHTETVSKVLQWDEYAFVSASEDCTIKVISA